MGQTTMSNEQALAILIQLALKASVPYETHQAALAAHEALKKALEKQNGSN